MWWERRIDSLVGGRIAIRPYMCDTTLVLGICWLHFSLFTFHFSPHTQAYSLGYTLHSSLFTLHSSLFTLHHIPKLIRLATLFTLHFSLFTFHFSLFTFHSPTCQHRAICKSPLQQNAKALMLIWDNHFSLPHSSSSSLEKKSSRSRRSFLVGRPSPFLR